MLSGGKILNKNYYISNKGKIIESIVFGEPYISVTCGSHLRFDPYKVKELLKSNTSYSIDLIEDSVAEVHLNEGFLFMNGRQTSENVPSSLTLEEFLNIIK